MFALGASDASCIRSTTPRTWSGFGSRQLLSTNQQARMTVQFHHNGTTSASLAVRMYIIPNEAMRCPLLLGRDSWMRFPSRSYPTLPPHPDGRTFGELTLSPCEDKTSAAPLPTSATARLQTMLTISSMTALVRPSPTPRSLFR